MIHARTCSNGVVGQLASLVLRFHPAAIPTAHFSATIGRQVFAVLMRFFG